MEWCTIESDPAVFTELIEKIGVKTPLEADEVVDIDGLASIEGCRGFILLFKYDKDTMAPTSRDASVGSADPSLFFAKQTIQNACGTLALLHVLLNADGVDLGEQLAEFRSFAQAIGDAGMVGDILGSSDAIRTAHNSFGRSEPFLADKSGPGEDGEAYHFVAYVPKNGALYELDGLQSGPICLGAVPEHPTAATAAAAAAASSSSTSSSAAEACHGWVRLAQESIRERIARYGSSGEIRFTLLSVQDSRLHRAEEAQKQAGARFVVANMVKAGGGGALARAQATSCVSPTKLGRGWFPESSPESLDAQVAALGAEVERANATVKELKAQRAEWAAENARRKHNWVPFAMQLLLECAKAGKLASMTAKGNARHKELIRRERERRAAAAGRPGH